MLSFPSQLPASFKNEGEILTTGLMTDDFGFRLWIKNELRSEILEVKMEVQIGWGGWARPSFYLLDLHGAAGDVDREDDISLGQYDLIWRL